MTTDDRVMPRPDADTAPFWAAAAEGRLQVQYCTACGAPRFYPRLLCPDCHSDQSEWREVSGKGVVYSFSVVHRAPTPAYAADVPYVVALIDLNEGVRMLANVIGEAASVRIGDRVTVRFRQLTEGLALPEFAREEALA